MQQHNFRTVRFVAAGGLACSLATSVAFPNAAAQAPAPERPARRLDSASVRGTTLRIVGRVTLGSRTADTGRMYIYVQSADRAYRVTSRALSPMLAVGDSVLAIGERDADSETPEIERAAVTRLAGAPREPAAQAVAIADEALRRAVARLVTFDAIVRSVQQRGGRGQVVVGDTGAASLTVAVVERRAGAVRLALDRFAAGDRVRITGVLAARRGEGGTVEWTVYPRRSSDVAALGLTRRVLVRMMWVFAALGGLIALGAALRSTRIRRRADIARRESDELVRAILNGTSQLIVFTDPDGVVRALNPAAAAALGGSESDVIGQPVLRLYDPGSVRRRAAELSGLAGCGIAVDFGVVVAGVPQNGSEDREWVFRRWDGMLMPVLTATTALYAPDGAIRGYAIVATDIGAVRAAQADAVRARDAAERANRVKSEFLANMSHELRTPLNSVIGFANILEKNRERRLTDQEVGYVNRIGANGRHLLGLINGILDLSKIEAGRIEIEWAEVDVRVLVSDTLAELESQAVAKRVTLAAEVPSTCAPLRTDPARLKQMLINLMGNALRFTERGTVTVRVVTEPPSGRVTAIEVSDTGCGIPSDRLEAIFEAFQQADSTTSRVHGGTGLGLTITRSLARLMGFDVSVSSAPGAGSTFRIVTTPFSGPATSPASRNGSRAAVPSASAAASTGSLAARAAGASPSGAGLFALIVDDEPDSRAVLGQQLRDLGCEVAEAASAADGLALARVRRPDLITLDIMMPETSGVEALREIAADPVLAAVPVVIISVVAEDYRGELGAAAAIIDKPASSATLADALRRTVPRERQPAMILFDEPDLVGVVDRIRSRQQGHHTPNAHEMKGVKTNGDSRANHQEDPKCSTPSRWSKTTPTTGSSYRPCSATGTPYASIPME